MTTNVWLKQVNVSPRIVSAKRTTSIQFRKAPTEEVIILKSISGSLGRYLGVVESISFLFSLARVREQAGTLLGRLPLSASCRTEGVAGRATPGRPGCWSPRCLEERGEGSRVQLCPIEGAATG